MPLWVGENTQDVAAPGPAHLDCSQSQPRAGGEGPPELLQPCPGMVEGTENIQLRMEWPCLVTWLCWEGQHAGDTREVLHWSCQARCAVLAHSTG